MRKKPSYKTMCINVKELEWLVGCCQDADICGIFGLNDGYTLSLCGSFLECFSCDLAEALLDGKTVKLRIFASSLDKYNRRVQK